ILGAEHAASSSEGNKVWRERTLFVGSGYAYREATGRPPFVGEQRVRDGPTSVHLADDVVGRDPHPVEELLAELGTTIDLPNGTNRQTRRWDRNLEPGEAPVLGSVPVGASQADGGVAVDRTRAPDLGAREHPSLSVADRPCEDAGQVGTRA